MCLLDTAWVPFRGWNVNKVPIGRFAWFVMFKLPYLGYKSGRGVFYSCLPAGVEEFHLLEAITGDCYFRLYFIITF